MMFLVLAALLSAAVTTLFAWPLFGHREKDAGEGAGAGADLSVYRDQLGELERDAARGLLPESEAAAARLEIQRRLLAAAGMPDSAPRPPRGATIRPLAAAALLLFLPAMAVGLYLHIGSPSLPGQPLASRTIPADGDQQLVNLAGLLEAKLTGDPSDAKAWALLGKIKGELGRYQESADDYAQAIARKLATGEAVDAGLQSLYGEALAAAADGRVTPKAAAALAAALTLDPKEPRARYYTALGEAQAGRLDNALRQWVALEADSAPDAPWLQMLADQIVAAAKQLGRDPATLPGRKPPLPTAGAAGVQPGPDRGPAGS